MKLLIVKLGAIGDVVHALPALAALRRSLPDAHLAWAVERGGSAQLLKDNPALDQLIELDLRGWRKRLLRPATLKEISGAVSRLRAAKFDISIDFQGLFKSAAIPWMAGIPRRTGFSKDALREPASSILLNEEVRVDDSDHVIKKNLGLVSHLGCDVSGEYQFPLTIDLESENFANDQMDRLDGSYAIVNPGGGWPTKLWGIEGFAAIADRLFETYGIRSIVTFGPGEEGLAQSVIDRTRKSSAVKLVSNLKQFYALAKTAKLFIGGDTGPMHLAAAAGTPIVSIFGPTSSRRNGPFAKDDVIIERFDLDCRVDCYRRVCSHTSCMKIPIETVWNGVVERLRGRQKRGEGVRGKGLGVRDKF